VGSLFYLGHKLVTDAKTGKFDRQGAKSLLETQDQVSAKTGIPCMVDVVGNTEEAMRHYIDFVAETTESPFLLDSTSADTKMAAIRYAAEIGLTKRVVYNSLMPLSSSDEFEAIREVKLEQAILLAYSKNLASTTERIEIIKPEEGTGLLDRAQEHGITKPLIDTVVLDIPTLGLACRAIHVLKDKFGLVCGCGAHNAVDTWRGLKTKFRSGLLETGVATSTVLAASAGADFILYGPLEHAEAVFPMVAMVDAAWGQLVFERTGKVDLQHPLFKIA
jgi:tetrahydromethanopterin S-methyltransferase subunit H